jgi:hypothetical protein
LLRVTVLTLSSYMLERQKPSLDEGITKNKRRIHIG